MELELCYSCEEYEIPKFIACGPSAQNSIMAVMWDTLSIVNKMC